MHPANYYGVRLTLYITHGFKSGGADRANLQPSTETRDSISSLAHRIVSDLQTAVDDADQSPMATETAISDN